MPSIVKRLVKGNAYYYMVESARINGKPRIVKQKYLGTADKIEKAINFASDGGIPEAEYSTVYEFGAVAALFDLAERIGIRKSVEINTSKRNQGLPVADTVLLAVINRAVEPVSKNVFFNWFNKTVLYNLLNRTTKQNLSSQGFWNNMNELDDISMRKIEDYITKEIVSTYEIETDCLLFDNTNFYTYINTSTTSDLAKRGKSKEHRTDLRIIGLSLMVSPDHNIPLFHETYSGNMNDAKRFSEIVDNLKARYKKLGKGDCTPTLVFDRGNNSEDNFKALSKTPKPYHVVGGLRFNQCPELTSIPKAEFIDLAGEQFIGYKAIRGKKNIYDSEYTVVLTYNPELFRTQLVGVTDNIIKCTNKLEELQQSLITRANGTVTKGRKPTFDSVSKKVNNILSAEHMKTIFDKKIEQNGDHISLEFYLNESKFIDLKENVLGKSIIITDNDDWSTEKIVATYHSQFHVEQCFRQMKDTKYLSFRPQYHFTDPHIKVHAFFCVLSLMLCSVLQLEMERLGHKLSIHKLLDILSDTKQVITVFTKTNGKTVQIKRSSFSGLEGIAKEYIDHYGLIKHSIKI
jgi:transposase